MILEEPDLVSQHWKEAYDEWEKLMRGAPPPALIHGARVMRQMAELMVKLDRERLRAIHDRRFTDHAQVLVCDRLDRIEERLRRIVARGSPEHQMQLENQINAANMLLSKTLPPLMAKLKKNPPKARPKKRAVR